MFFWCFFEFFQKHNVFFGFSRFLVLENLENSKKHNVFFYLFSVLIEKSKKQCVFFGFFN